jgi:hypothetical protein
LPAHQGVQLGPVERFPAVGGGLGLRYFFAARRP